MTKITINPDASFFEKRLSFDHIANICNPFELDQIFDGLDWQYLYLILTNIIKSEQQISARYVMCYIGNIFISPNPSHPVLEANIKAIKLKEQIQAK